MNRMENVRHRSVKFQLLMMAAVLGTTALRGLGGAAAPDPVVDAVNWQVGTGDWFVADHWIHPYYYDQYNEETGQIDSILTSDSRVPWASDRVFINNGGTAQISSSGANAGALHIGVNGGWGTLNVPGGSLYNANTVKIGTAGGAGSLAISAGGSVNSRNYAYVGSDGGYLFPSSGSVSVDGAGSIWTVNYSHYIGYNGGMGSLTITGGGHVVTNLYSSFVGSGAGSQGLVTLDGTNSSWSINGYGLLLGHNGGNGTINMTSGAQMSTNWDAEIGIGAGSVGLLTLQSGATFTTGRNFYVSESGSTGTVSITNGGILHTNTAPVGTIHWASYIGYGESSVGLVTVDGTESSWTNDGILELGSYGGQGTLTITGGGTASTESAKVGYSSGTTLTSGVLNVDGSGSTYTIQDDLDLGTYGASGTLNISNGGHVSVGFNGYVGYQNGGVGNVNVDGAGSSLTAALLTIGGMNGQGTMRVTGGGAVSSGSANVGFSDGIGSAQVVGAGSTWTIDGSLGVGGAGGQGTLLVAHGGQVIVTDGCGIGTGSIGSAGAVVVTGGSSTLSVANGLDVGWDQGVGSLSILKGGSVSAGSVTIGTGSMLAMDIGYNSRLTISGGSGTITNNGTLRFLVASAAAAGDYQPIYANTWAGGGTYQVLGGAWQADTHIVHVAPALVASVGTPLAFNRHDVQRIIIQDPGTGQSVGISLGATDGDTMMTLLANLVTGQTRTDLQTLMGPGQTLLAGWLFEPSGGYTPGELAFLTMDIGSGFTPDMLNVWHFDGTTWQSYTPGDLVYGGTTVGFTVSGFSGYAVSAVPEPTSIGLLIAAALVVGWRRSTRT